MDLYYFSFSSEIATVTAQGGTGITYDIISGNEEDTFDINSYSGGITLVRNLDYEKVKSYKLKISAVTSQQLSSSCDVLIDVLDVNDNG